MSTGNHYSPAFYQGQRHGSADSARIILPMVFDQLGPTQSVVDVGGGVGTWSRVASNLGVEHVRLIEGTWARDGGLECPEEFLVTADLEADLRMDERFDLAMCLEVAEHLSPGRAPGLVKDLTALSDTVLFSAAIPGQGGTNHINEQWLSYWVRLFDERGYGLIDTIRPRIWSNPSVRWWYAQNMVLFVKGAEPNADSRVDLVHPALFEINRTHLERAMQPVEKYLPAPLKRRALKRVYEG